MASFTTKIKYPLGLAADDLAPGDSTPRALVRRASKGG